MKRNLFAVFIMVFMLLPFVARADIFDITIVVNPDTADEQTYTASFSSVTDVIDELDTDEIEARLDKYDENTSAAEVTINFRGVPIYLSMAANSSTITMSVPSADISETFTGSDRDAAVDSIEDWLESDGEDAVTRLMQTLVSDTATDPVAGNPASLQTRMVNLDYMYGVNSADVIEMNTEGMGTETVNDNTMSLGAMYTVYDMDGTDVTEYVIPLAYTINFNKTKNNLSFRIPVSYVDTDGSQSYTFAFGLGLTWYVKDQWSLTPAASYGAVGSIDLGSVAQVTGYSLTSAYHFYIGDYTLTMGNMIGQYDTIPFEYEDYELDMEISNTVIKNGFIFNIPTDDFAAKSSIELSVADTRFSGSDLYVEQFNEVGISFGRSKVTHGSNSEEKVIIEEPATLDNVRLGLSYLFGKDVEGYTVKLSFAF